MLLKTRNFVSAFFVVALYIIVAYWVPQVRRRLLPMTIVALAVLLVVAAVSLEKEEKVVRLLNAQAKAKAANLVQHFATYRASMFTHPSTSGVEKTQ